MEASGNPQKGQHRADEAKLLRLGVLENEILRRDDQLLAGVVHNLVRFAFGHDANSVVLADEDNLKAAFAGDGPELDGR